MHFFSKKLKVDFINRLKNNFNEYYLCLISQRSDAKFTSPETNTTAAGEPCRSANLLIDKRSFSSAAFLHTDVT